MARVDSPLKLEQYAITRTGAYDFKAIGGGGDIGGQFCK